VPPENVIGVGINYNQATNGHVTITASPAVFYYSKIEDFSAHTHTVQTRSGTHASAQTRINSTTARAQARMNSTTVRASSSAIGQRRPKNER
jgi:hypothetical protein